MYNSDWLLWRITWTLAFPFGAESLMGERFDDDFRDAWRFLVFRIVWSEGRIDKSCETTYKCDSPNSWNSSLGYGEITEQTVFAILRGIERRTRPRAIECVVDLGSGTGRVVLAAAIALLPTLTSAIGLEIVPGLHQRAIQLQTTWNEELLFLSSGVPSGHGKLQFHCCDFTVQTEWIDTADLILIHCTVFEDALFDLTCQLCSRARPGTWIVTVSRPLNNAPTGPATFECISDVHLEMSWGIGRVYVQRRV
jgi:Histone methylation protein DOT1